MCIRDRCTRVLTILKKMNIQLPECILLDDNEKQVIKDAFLSYIQDLEVKAKKDRILSVEAYEDVMDRLSEIIKKLQLAS